MELCVHILWWKFYCKLPYLKASTISLRVSTCDWVNRDNLMDSTPAHVSWRRKVIFCLRGQNHGQILIVDAESHTRQLLGMRISLSCIQRLGLHTNISQISATSNNAKLVRTAKRQRFNGTPELIDNVLDVLVPGHISIINFLQLAFRRSEFGG